MTVRAPRQVVSDTSRASLFWGFHEAQEIRFVHSHLPANSDVVELGASLGVVSAHIARKLESGRRLICVEANPQLAASLRQTVLHNAPGAEVEVIQAAIDYSGNDAVPFSITSDVLTSHIAEDGAQAVHVPAITLAEVLNRHHIGRLSLVCDIEGAEAQLLAQDSAALKGCETMIIELHATREASVNELKSRLAGLGFITRAERGPVLVLTK